MAPISHERMKTLIFVENKSGNTLSIQYNARKDGFLAASSIDALADTIPIDIQGTLGVIYSIKDPPPGNFSARKNGSNYDLKLHNTIEIGDIFIFNVTPTGTLDLFKISFMVDGKFYALCVNGALNELMFAEDTVSNRNILKWGEFLIRATTAPAPVSSPEPAGGINSTLVIVMCSITIVVLIMIIIFLSANKNTLQVSYETVSENLSTCADKCKERITSAIKNLNSSL